MEQRRLRLGDILDDYCPRERRVTNHAVVAMVEEDVKQTRCTTCDAEHIYKGGHAPRRKKAETTGKLYKQVLAGLTDEETAAAAVVPATMPENMIDEPESADEPIEIVAAVVEPERGAAPPEEPLVDDVDVDVDIDNDEPQPAVDEGPVHRPLIRAQLPRVEGLKPERVAPEFTIRNTNTGRGGGNFRGGGGGGDMRMRAGGASNGPRFGRGPNRGAGNGNGSGGRNGGPNQGFNRGPRNNKRGR